LLFLNIAKLRPGFRFWEPYSGPCSIGKNSSAAFLPARDSFLVDSAFSRTLLLMRAIFGELPNLTAILRCASDVLPG
jgi:hypothetical protein